jgi:hypothetical protein
MYVDPKSTELQDRVHAVINRLLEVYRFATKEFHVDVVPKNELWEYEAFSTNEDGRTFPSPIHCVRMMPFGYGTRLARSSPISEEARRFLSDGTRLPLEGVMNFSPYAIASGHGYSKTIPRRCFGPRVGVRRPISRAR